METRRVAITGLGAVTSIGIGRREFARSLKEGRHGFSPLRGPNALGFPFDRGGEVHDFDPGLRVKRQDPSRLGRSSQFAVAAAAEAIADADLLPEQLAAAGCAVSIGTTDGESRVTDELTRQVVEQGFSELSPQLVSIAPADRLGLAVAREFGLAGEVTTISTACAAGNFAIGNAFDLVRTGEVEFALGGGAESIARKSLAGFYRLGAMAPTACQPFDAERRGIIAGEGSGVLLLEALDSALARGAHIYAEVLGYGLSCDAKHATTPDTDSISLCMRRAHANSGVAPGDIDYICAHGTGTTVNDAVEAKAILKVFGSGPPPTSSIKSMLGHTMGAASALGCVASCIALVEQFMPPTINYQAPDPDCALDCIPNQSRPAHLRVVQNNGFAFGGNNAIVIFRAWPGSAPKRAAA